jgi:glycosyltransferase involved in cell wall biosynthesis
MTNYSVLISTYIKDNPQFLKEALNSIYLQSFPPTEVVLVKDGQLTIELEGVIQEYCLKLPLKIISLNRNKGLGKALKKGLKACSHEIVIRMDSDDVAHIQRMEKLILFFQKNNDYDIVGSFIEEFLVIPGDLKRLKKVPENHHEIVSFSKFRSPFNHPSVAFRKSAVLDSGNYKSMLFFEDYYLWLRLIKSGAKCYNIQEPLLYFRTGTDLVKRRGGLNYAVLEYKFFRKAFKKDLISMNIFLVSLLRFPLRILPVWLLSFVYSWILRDGSNNSSK